VRLPRRRSFASAELSDLFSGFTGTTAHINEELRGSLRTMRARSRQLCQDNDYAAKFLNMVGSNVIGNSGIMLQSEAVGPDGTADEENRKLIEAAWKDWGELGTPEVTGTMSWIDVQRLVIETLARDGEVLVVDYATSDNAFGYAVQVLECDRLNEAMNAELDNGNRIVMGVELSPLGKPVAYHLLTAHPGETTHTWAGRYYTRVPASRVNHLFITKRAEQARGIPWMNTAIRRLDMLGGYEEAEWTAARVAACKMGVVTTPDGDGYEGDDEDADGNILDDVEAGTFRQLAQGQTLEMFDPKHPNSAYESFAKSVLRGAASGMNVTYTALANDLEGVNFSSIRAGVLEEREQWRSLQAFVADALCDRAYRVWLGHALLSGALTIPPRKTDGLRVVRWVPRGWAWVDPLKDLDAAARSVELGIGTRTDAAAAQGRDFVDVVKRLAEEEQILKDAGLDKKPEPQPQPPQPPPPPEPDDDDGDDGDNDADAGDDDEA